MYTLCDAMPLYIALPLFSDLTNPPTTTMPEMLFCTLCAHWAQSKFSLTLPSAPRLAFSMGRLFYLIRGDQFLLRSCSTPSRSVLIYGAFICLSALNSDASLKDQFTNISEPKADGYTDSMHYSIPVC